MPPTNIPYQITGQPSPPILTDCPSPPYARAYTHFTQPPQSWTEKRAPHKHYTPRHTPSTRQHISAHGGGNLPKATYPSRVKIIHHTPRKSQNNRNNGTPANDILRHALYPCKWHHLHHTNHKKMPPQPIQHRHNRCNRQLSSLRLCQLTNRQ